MSVAPYLPDVLTSMPNREAFCEQADEALRSSDTISQSVSVIYIDFDNFKSVNGLHGRKVGDQLLRSAARRLGQVASDAAMIARVGGDEFACLFLGLPDSTRLESPARRILASIAAPVMVDAFELALVPSIGIVFCADRDTNANAILRWAASAMYRARHERSGYAFSDYQKHSAPRPLFHFGSRGI